MRVNVYAEEMTQRVEIIEKVIDGRTFTGVRFYLELPGSYVRDAATGERRPARIDDTQQAVHDHAPFIHHPGDDDSAAVTFWGKTDLRKVLSVALEKLDDYYREVAKA